MKTRVLQQLAHHNHFRTLQSSGLPLAAYGVYGDGGVLVWSADSVDDAMARPLIGQDMARLSNAKAAHRHFQHLDGSCDGPAYAIDVVDESDGFICRIVAEICQSIRFDDRGCEVRTALTAIANNVLHEFGLNRELETMATELAERYEELNLVFESGTPTGNRMSGFEALRGIVKDTTAYLNVGMAALLFPGKQLEIYDLDEGLSIPNASRLLSRVCADFSGAMRESGDSIVLNNTRDLERVGVVDTLGYKMMLVPVNFGSDDVKGVLVAANEVGCADFSNSDRNLLEVMAAKAVKVLQASFDPLTGLENAASFECALRHALAKVVSRGVQHAILKVNIDRTSVINDISGRDAGDAMIRRVGQILRHAVRAQDTISRLAGDEFGVLLESCDIDAATRLAERMCGDVEKENFTWRDSIHPLNVSIGVAPITADTESVSAILSSARVARQAAKERGGNRVEVYKLNDVELVRRRGEFRWVGRIQTALREGRFCLHAQRIMPLTGDGQPLSYEVLVRMRGDSDELISPNRFIPAAEHYHLMPAIDRWVVRSLVDRMLDATARGVSVPHFSVNLSGQSLGDNEVRDVVFEQLERLGPLAKQISFEITESAAVDNLDEALDFIRFFREYGVRFSLDDFGSGLSSFAYLTRFDVDCLKLDGSFVRFVHEDKVARAMVEAINKVGQVMGLKTIAEYVENAAIEVVLHELGVDCAQGYHIAKPAPLADVLGDAAKALHASRP